MVTRLPHPKTLQALEDLIAFDTTSAKSNLDLIDWVETQLVGLGARCERVLDQTGRKANLWATFGPAHVPGWVLSGHTDTVPVTGQAWSTDPYRLTPIDGQYFGRGTCDMKGFLACCLGMAAQIAAQSLRVPIHLAFSYDEEIGCVGVRTLLTHLAARQTQLLGCIIGEPTMMQVCIGHKSKRGLRATIVGIPGHSSRAPEFVNAVEYGARLVTKIQEIGRRLASGSRDEMFDTPHSTAHVGTMNGGTALNIVPELCTIDFEFRTIAADDPDALVDEIISFADQVLLPEMRAIDERADIRIDLRSAFPGVDTPADHEVVHLAQHFARRNDLAKVAFGTEGGLFQQVLGVPTVVCGPGSIAQAHKPDEFIHADQLVACEDFIASLINECRI